MGRILGFVWVYMQKMELRYWWNKKSVYTWKAFVDTVGIKGADLEDKFLLQSFAAFRTAQI